MSMHALFVRLLGYVSLTAAQPPPSIGQSALGLYAAWMCNTDPNTPPQNPITTLIPFFLCNILGVRGAQGILAKVTSFILAIAVGIGVCVFIYACIRMIMSQGQDDKVSAAKRMAIIALVGVFLMLSVQPIISTLQTVFTAIAPAH